MSLQSVVPWLLTGMLMSALGMVFGVSRGLPPVTLIAAAAYAIFLVVISFRTNAPYWGQRQDGQRDEAAAVAARRNARLMAVCYNWGAIAILAIYTLTPLRWQHGWQYALAMALLAVVCFAFAIRIGQTTGSRRNNLLRIAAMATAVQGVLAACVLLYLVSSGKLMVGSGKLMTSKSDWPANDVFFFGSIALTALSAFALRTHRSLQA